MLSMVFAQVGLPLEGIGLILRRRSTTRHGAAVNVTGDAVVSTVVFKSEGKFDESVFNNPAAETFEENETKLKNEGK